MFFFSYISIPMGLKGLIVMATMFGSATGLLMFSFVPICIADSDTLQIDVIGPMSGKDNETGQAMLDGVNLYVNEVNKSGGINDRTLEVIAYDDQNDKVMARKRAMEIAKESKTLKRYTRELQDVFFLMTGQNIAYRAYRIKGNFKEAFIFRDYPFDSQTLSIRFRHKKFNSERLVFVTDDIGMQRFGGRTPAGRLKEYLGLSE